LWITLTVKVDNFGCLRQNNVSDRDVCEEKGYLQYSGYVSLFTDKLLNAAAVWMIITVAD
jgi:hypothetical protein